MCGNLGQWKKHCPEVKDATKHKAETEGVKSQESSANSPKKKKLKRDHLVYLSVKLAVDKLINNNEVFYLISTALKGSTNSNY